MAPRRLLGSGDEKYCWIRVRKAGKTWVGGRFVAKPSMMRNADYRTISTCLHQIAAETDLLDMARHRRCLLVRVLW